MLAVLLCACATPSNTSAPSALTVGCRSGPPEAGVHNPDRLRVLDPCQHAAGTVVDVAREDDGDYHIWFKPDAGYESLLNAENHFQARPAMLAEIVPACPLDSKPSNAAAAARCPKTRLPIPVLGNHISLWGPWVLDTDHGWQEIHPADSIQIG
ncbi:MAG: hypothetical protein E6J20_07070 [Chloroflexi bacterium]|nr:MAG: hypothetical protein E6J20_07070 [Chloroflexota bacterium]